MTKRLPILERPKTRNDCRDSVRPCPWVGCRYHLFLEVSSDGKILCPWKEDAIRWSSGDGEDQYAELVASTDRPTCVLDVVEKHPDGLTLAEIAERLGVDPTRVERAQQSALERLRGLDSDALAMLSVGDAFDDGESE